MPARSALNAFRVVLHAAAQAEAEQVAQRLAAGEHLPLAGVPIAVKDDMPFAGQVCSRSEEQPHPHAGGHGGCGDRAPPARGLGRFRWASPARRSNCLFPYSESALGGIIAQPLGSVAHPPVAPAVDRRQPSLLAWCPWRPVATAVARCVSPALDRIPALFATQGQRVDRADEHDWFGMASMGALARSIADTALAYDVLFTQPQDLAGARCGAAAGVRIGTSLDRAINQPIPQAGAVDPARARAMDLTASLLERLGHSVAPTPPAVLGIRRRSRDPLLECAAEDLAHCR